MASQRIVYNPDDLAQTAQAYQQAADGFATAKSAFVETGSDNPGFGLFMMALYPSYTSCKIATQGYLGNIGQMTEKLSTALQGASEDSQQVECDCQDQIAKLQKRIDEQDDRLTALENGQNGGIVGGASGTVGGGGSSGSSGTSGMYGISTPTQETSTDTSTRETNDAWTSYAPITTTNEGGSDTQHSGSTADATQSADRKTDGTTSTIGFDANGDAEDDYSLNLTEGDTQATVLEDGSIKLSKRDSPSISMPSGTNAGKTNSFSVDADHDGVDDVSITPDVNADARISIFDKDGSRYAAIDFDHDGDYDAAVRIGDSEAAREAMRRETEESIWQSIAAKDPLNRTVDELKALYQDRDIVELPERSEIKQ